MQDLLADETLLFTPATAAADAIPVTFAFPNTYTVGITSLGFQVVWATLAQRSDLAVSRLFTDGPLPSTAPELLGFSVSWELDYVNILSLLERLDIPTLSGDRQAEHPLVFGGGPVLTANPEPFADFFDLILLGDGENLLPALIDTYQKVRHAPRATQLRALAQVPGIYVPALYAPHYEGLAVAYQPIEAGIPDRLQKQTYRGSTLSTSTVVTPHAAWENIYMVEVVRSCPEMCRFCLASYLTLPFRTADLADGLIPAVERGLTATSRLGLLGASITQHPQFEDLLDYLGQGQFDHVRLSLASVRTSTVTEKLTSLLTRRGSHSLTVAVESGSERLRQVINKKLSQDEIAAAAIAAQAGGLKSLKLYGMVGLPSETESDLAATVTMVRHLRKIAPKLKLTLGCSTFVPKAHTPFQWYGVDEKGNQKLKRLQKEMRPLGVDFRPESYNWSVIQALISRGDRRLRPLLELARTYGESVGSYRRAWKALHTELEIPPLDYYIHQPWAPDQPLPWGHLQGGLPPERLQEHRLHAEQMMAMTTP